MTGPLTRFGINVESREQRDRKILDGVLAAVMRQAPQAVLASVLGAAALVAVFWQHASQNLAVAWAVLVLAESLARLRVARAFRQSGDAAARAAAVQTWARRWQLLALAAGALWGAAAWVFFAPSQPLLQPVLVAVVFGVTFASLGQYASHPPSFNAFVPLALLPLIARMVVEGDTTYTTAALVLAAVFVFIMFWGRSLGAALHESVKNNYENEVLVDQLIAEKKLAEDARRAAENATRSRTQFFAAASHDLRQPLQAIGIYVSLLKKRAQGPLEPLVNNLSSAVESLSRLVEELLEISRLDAGAITPRVEQLLLDELFTTLEQEFTPQAASKGLSLRVRRAGHAVDTDPLLLARVLRNLLANAIRYTPRGGVLLASRTRGAAVSVEIWDTGPGIKQAELDRVFEEFYRGESSKAENSGAGFGLGLSIVRRICGLLGHPLIVTTRPGAGTVFRVETPPSARPRRARRSSPGTLELAIRSLEGHCVVLLEDNAEILNSLTRLLRSWGAEVIPATGFNTALMQRLSGPTAVSAVVADHNLGPHSISGAEAVFRIRELVGRPVPVIMLTAVQASEVATEFHRAMQARMQANPARAEAIAVSRVEEPRVLQKPSTPAVLNAAIADALGLPLTVAGAVARPAQPTS